MKNKHYMPHKGSWRTVIVAATMAIIVLLLTGCDSMPASQYVYPEFIEKATDFCELNDGIEKLVVTSSRRPGHINAGAWGYVDCNNTARFDFHVLVVRKEIT